MKAFLTAAHKTAQHGLALCGSGNLSCRKDEHHMLISASQVGKVHSTKNLSGGESVMLAVLRSFKVPLYFVNQPLCIVNFFFSTALFQPFTKLVKLLLKSRNQLFFHLIMNIIR